MTGFQNTQTRRTSHGLRLLTLAILVFTIITAGNGFAENAPQGQGFTSPQKAFTALIATVREHDVEKTLSILGPDAEEIIFSGDEVEGKKETDAFVDKFDKKHYVEILSPTLAIFFIGNDNWPFPIPLEKRGKSWFFDVMAGKDEILNRRIGENELNVIQVMQAYIVAQHEYASKDRDGDGFREYAQQIKSDPGKKNGLYWHAKKNEKRSPLGSLITEVDKERNDTIATGITPYHGYFYKIMTQQGEKAPGGAYDYVVDGNMILGFGLMAYPAKYGASGIMTFAVNQEGIIYEVDLNEKTAEIVMKSDKYNLNKTWQKVIELDLEL